MSQSIGKQALSRIYGHGRGWAFSPNDFHDLGRVDMALIRLIESETIRRVFRVIYDYPRFSELLNQELAPDIHQVAQALARKFGWRIQADGTAAMNLIGISTQVPSQFVFQSDGPDRNYKVGKTSILFKHTALKEIGFRQSGESFATRTASHRDPLPRRFQTRCNSPGSKTGDWPTRVMDSLGRVQDSLVCRRRISGSVCQSGMCRNGDNTGTNILGKGNHFAPASPSQHEHGSRVFKALLRLVPIGKKLRRKSGNDRFGNARRCCRAGHAPSSPT